MAAEVAAAREAEAAALAARTAAAAERAAQRAAARDAERAAAAAALPPEPPAGDPAVAVLARLPSGVRLTRRFGAGCTLRTVRDWVRSDPSAADLACRFELVANFPRFVASASNADAPLSDAAGGAGAVTFFVSELDDPSEDDVDG